MYTHYIIILSYVRCIILPYERGTRKLPRQHRFLKLQKHMRKHSIYVCMRVCIYTYIYIYIYTYTYNVHTYV